MALEHDLEALAARADQRTAMQKLVQRVRAGKRREVIRAWRRLLLDPKTGEVSADAAMAMADLSGLARMGVIDLPDVSEAELRMRAGLRAAVLHIIARLDLNGRSLRKLAKILRETADE